jgi:RNA polymerase sigma-70 factor (ECF subfamily)
MRTNTASRPNHAQRTDESTAKLLERCGQGDKAAFRTLYDANSPRLYGLAMRITRNPALASDAVHDAMLQVWRHADRYRAERGDADAWLVSLVRYRALDIARRSGREITGLEMPDTADEEPDALSVITTDDDGRALRACLEEVDPTRRRLVLLSFVEGKTQAEIAEQLGQPLGTVKSTIRRVLIGLRSCMERLVGAPR